MRFSADSETVVDWHEVEEQNVGMVRDCILTV